MWDWLWGALTVDPLPLEGLGEGVATGDSEKEECARVEGSRIGYVIISLP
jgi:hypothetical protein